MIKCDRIIIYKDSVTEESSKSYQFSNSKDFILKTFHCQRHQVRSQSPPARARRPEPRRPEQAKDFVGGGLVSSARPLGPPFSGSSRPVYGSSRVAAHSLGVGAH